MTISIFTIIPPVNPLAAVWLGQDAISSPDKFPILLAALAGLVGFCLLLPLVESRRKRQLHLAWRQRLERQEGFTQTCSWRNFLEDTFQTFNNWLEDRFQNKLAGIILGWWRDCRAGGRPLSLLASLLCLTGTGILVGEYILETLLLKGLLIFLLLIGFFSLIYSRARNQRQLFQDQFPAVLERLADSLQAGFSLPQAIDFVVPNLPQPSSGEMSRVGNMIRLGYTIDQALLEMNQRRPSQDIQIFIEGVALQRQIGGNMPAMMQNMAQLVRNRVELENEVKTMTAQGRLSAVVIALLVPISLGLLSFIPGYTEVLFRTIIGNLVLAAALILELIGALLVARLVRIEV